ncbi:MAG TPA: hypothetical protein VF756_17525 [Thermoanaerobaculia bacterium]
MNAPLKTWVPTFLLVDAHVHFHPSYDFEAFLDGALANFRRGAADVGLPGPFTGCLLLTEMGDARWFRSLLTGSADGGAWRIERTAEANSLIARRASGERLVLVAGRQIAASEGLEVLALGRDAEIPDGLPLAETLRQVRESGALPVLPWGFGKWLGRRGALIAGTLAGGGDGSRGELFLGDNGGRPGIGGPPQLFAEARVRGVRVLPGSDPLPLPEHERRAGSYGFVLEGALDESRPAEDLLRKIRGLRGQPRVYGRCAALPRFLRDQIGLRWPRSLRQAARSAEAAS